MGAVGGPPKSKNNCNRPLGMPVGLSRKVWSFRISMRNGLDWVDDVGGPIFTVGRAIPTVGIQDHIEWRG